MKKILIRSNLKAPNGLSYHRLIVPYSKVSDMVDFQCDVFNDVDIISDQQIQNYSAVVYQREISVTGKSKEIIDRHHKNGLKVIFDIDDYWHLPQTHHLYSTYKDHNVPKQTEEVLRLVDLVTTTTEHLANIIRKFNKNVHVIPNCLDVTEEQWQSNKTYSDLIRFGYISGVHHVQDVRILERPIMKTLASSNNCGFVLGGYSNNEHYKYYEKVLSGNGSAKNRYERIGASDVYNYGKSYNSTEVSLVPLASSTFSACKSEIKMLEAAAHGNAVISSNVLPYNTFPKKSAIFVENHNVNGWHKAIKELSKNKDKRDELASELDLYVKCNYDLNKWTRIRKQILQSVLA